MNHTIASANHACSEGQRHTCILFVKHDVHRSTLAPQAWQILVDNAVPASVTKMTSSPYQAGVSEGGAGLQSDTLKALEGRLDVSREKNVAEDKFPTETPGWCLK